MSCCRSSKVLVDALQDVPETLGHEDLLGVPHLTDNRGECANTLALVAKNVVPVDLRFVNLLIDIVMVKKSNVRQTLHSRVHIACVAHIVNSHCLLGFFNIFQSVRKLLLMVLDAL